MIRRELNIRGETLAETIIALSILAIGIAVASTVMINSFRNLTNAKNRVIAVNLSREGIEAVRNIRDTNWLFYSGQRRQCWNHDPSAGPCDISAPVPITPGVYIVYKHADGSWRLAAADLDVNQDEPEDADTIPDNDVDPAITRLSLVNVSAEAQPDGDWDGDSDPNNVDTDDDNDSLLDDADPYPLDDQNDPTNVASMADMYNHKTVTDSFGGEVSSTGFRRYIVIEYMENEPSLDSQTNPPDDAVNTLEEWDDLDASDSLGLLNRMRVTSVVSWIRSGAEHTAELTTIITDHLGREDLSS